MYKLTTLDNGLRILTRRIPGMHSFVLGLWLRTGGRYENEKTQGISHFIEHMLFKGTERRSCQQIKRDIEEKGGAFNAFTSEEAVCYYVRMLSKHIGLASEVLSDMVLNASFPINEIEKERKVIYEEIRMYLDLPMHYVHDLLDELIWPNHALGLPLLGNYDTVNFFKRKDFIERKELFHQPNNIVAVCCGEITHSKFIDIISNLFKKTKSSERIGSNKIEKAPAHPAIKFLYKETEQSHLCLGVRGFSKDDPQRYALVLLNIILGGNMSSRLFNEIREKRSLAYEIGSSTKFYSDTGSFLVHAGIDNKKAVKAVSVIMNELRKTVNKDVTQEEFNMAKEYYKSGILMGLEDTMSNMLFLGEQMTTMDKIFTKDKILKMIDKVTIDMLKAAARCLFSTENLRLAMIGPQTKKDQKEIERLLVI